MNKWQVAAGLGVPWNFCWVATDWALELSEFILVWWTPLFLTCWLREPISYNLHTTRGFFSDWIQQAASKWRQILGFLGSFADLLHGSVLVEDRLVDQIGPSHTHPGPAEVAYTVDHFGAPKRKPWVIRRQQLTLTYTRGPHRKPQNQHTGSRFLPYQSMIQLATKVAHSKKDLNSTRPCWGKFWFVGSALTEQLIYCGQDWFT